jgi:hypothetical protein
MPKRPSKDLVQIEATEVPPTHQSTELLMGCKKNYVTQTIEKRRNPGGVESMRGREIHHTMSLYLPYCALKGVEMDLDAFDRFSDGAGALASKILVGMRDNYRTDHAHLFATEVNMCLDENFQPTNLIPELDGICKNSGLPAAYEGILDALFIYKEENKILVDDFKSHPRPYNPSDPDKSMQGKEYSLFCFQHFPWAQDVKFRLVFVRFNNVTRDVVYTRSDVPKLIEAVKSLRARQIAIHEEYISGKEIEATGNDGCFYCPLLSSRECPILRDNPAAQGEPSEWLSSSLVYSAYAKVNNARMKAWVQTNGRPIVLKDYNQKCFTYGPVETESSVYPLFQGTGKSIATRCGCGAVFDYVPEDGLCPTCQDRKVVPIMPVVDELISYGEGNVKDTDWFGKLVISSTELNSKLGAKKRSFVDQLIQDKADKVTKIKMKVSKPLDSLPESDDEFNEDDNDFDNEF